MLTDNILKKLKGKASQIKSSSNTASRFSTKSGQDDEMGRTLVSI